MPSAQKPAGAEDAERALSRDQPVAADPPRRPRLIKGLPAPRALSSPTRTSNKILWETVIY